MINEYLDTLYGTNEGYVAVAYKDRGNSWQEQEFSWPRDRQKLLAWAKIHRDANLFICPALRGGGVRKKNDGIWLQWLWADIDWDKVPANQRPAVERKIAKMATLVVESGSVGGGGRNNAHVYVRLSEVVSIDKFNQLNTWLRDQLCADSKQADNSLLRIPGSTNWKTTAGSPVRVVKRNGPVVKVSSIEALKSYQNTTVIEAGGSTEWTKVDVSGVKARLRRLVRMEPDEAEDRFGSRHKAVWAVTGDLIKGGLTDDEIHTLMDAFPPAEAKNLDEHGSYDVHKDVAKRIAWERSRVLTDELSKGGDEDPGDGGGDEGGDEGSKDKEDWGEMEVVSDEEADEDERKRAMEKVLRQRQAVRDADHYEATAGFVAPPADVSWNLADALQMPPEPDPMLIEGMWPARGNVVLTAQYKTGKTAFVMGSIAPAICDGEDFLGKFKVHVGDDGAMLGHWNLEMDSVFLLDQYLRPVGIKNTHNLAVANLLGYRINLLSAVGKAWAIEWLKERNVRVWTIDSWGELARMAGINTNDMTEVSSLLGAINEIKREAGVDAFLILAHTGRAKQEEGEERAMGSAYLDAWPDVRWILTKGSGANGDTRYLMAEGRMPKFARTSLVFNNLTLRSVIGVESGDGGMVEGDDGGAGGGPTQAVYELVKSNPGIHEGSYKSKSGLWVLMRKRYPRMTWSQFQDAVVDARDTEFVFMRRGRATGGGRVTSLFYPRGWDVKKNRMRGDG